MKHTSSSTAFTLIELMIAVLIASLLTAIAIPSYRNYSSRARIPEATSQLIAYRMKMEQSFQDNQTYGIKGVCSLTFNSTENFTYECVTQNNDQTYTITARGNRKNSMNEFAYTIDELGNTRTTALPQAWGTAPKNCWVIKEIMECM